MAELHRDDNGTLPAFAWPGGYPIYYLTKDGLTVCPACANRPVDESQAVVSGAVNWEEPMSCEDCGLPIESAYGPESEERCEWCQEHDIEDCRHIGM